MRVFVLGVVVVVACSSHDKASPSRGSAAKGDAAVAIDPEAPVAVEKLEMSEPPDDDPKLGAFSRSFSAVGGRWEIVGPTNPLGDDPQDFLRLTLGRPVQLKDIRLTTCGADTISPKKVTAIVDGNPLPTVDIDLVTQPSTYTPPEGHIPMPASAIRTIELRAPHLDTNKYCVWYSLVTDKGPLQPLKLFIGSEAAAESLPGGLRMLAKAIERCDPSLADSKVNLQSFIRPGGPASLRLEGTKVVDECRAGGLPPLNPHWRWYSAGDEIVTLVDDDEHNEVTVKLDEGRWHLSDIHDARRIAPAALAKLPPETHAWTQQFLRLATPASVTASATSSGSLDALLAHTGPWCAPLGSMLTFAVPRGLFLGKIDLEVPGNMIYVSIALGAGKPRRVPTAGGRYDTMGTMVTTFTLQLGDPPAAGDKPGKPACLKKLEIFEYDAKEPMVLLQGVTPEQLDALPAALATIAHTPSKLNPSFDDAVLRQVPRVRTDKNGAFWLDSFANHWHLVFHDGTWTIDRAETR